MAQKTISMLYNKSHCNALRNIYYIFISFINRIEYFKRVTQYIKNIQLIPFLSLLAEDAASLKSNLILIKKRHYKALNMGN